MSLPDDWQRHMVAMIRGATPLSGEWFHGSATLSPEAQIAVYHEQYRLRIWDALTEEVPGLLGLLPEPERVLWAFLDAHPPQDWTLASIADPLAAWLEANGATEAEVDMAKLDNAVMRGFVAADLPVLAAHEVSADARLKLQPHVTLLRLRANVHQVRSAVLAEQPAPPLVRGDYPVTVFRLQRGMRHLELDAGAYAILTAISGGATVAEAVEAALTEVPAEQLGARLGGWFELFAARGLLTRTD